MAVMIASKPSMRGVAVVHSDSLLDGLLLYYPCNEGTGTTLTDVHAGNNGTLVNSMNWTTSSKLGNNALRSTDTLDRVDFGSLALFSDIYDKFSFSFWVKLNSFPTGTNYGCFIYVRHGVSQPCTSCYVSSDNRIWFYANSYVGSLEYTYTSVLSNTTSYFHVACVANGIGNNLKIYINGNDDTQRVAAQEGPLLSPWDGLSHIMNNGGTRIVNGYIDEIAIYKKALTQTDITRLFNSGNGLTYPFNS